MSVLEERLHDLAAHVELPAEPDVAAPVMARVRADAGAGRRAPVARFGRRRLAIPLAVLALLVGGVAAVPSARSAVLRWLGLEGVRIERVPEAPTPAPTTLELGERVPLPAGALVPDELGEPDEVYRDREFLTLLYRPRDGLPEAEASGAGALVTQFPGQPREELIQKLAGPDTTIDAVEVDGEPGYWLAGAAHGLIYLHPTGDIREAPMRLAGPTLVWRRGDLTLRLEADLSKSRALAIARSVR